MRRAFGGVRDELLGVEGHRPLPIHNHPRLPRGGRASRDLPWRVVPGTNYHTGGFCACALGRPETAEAATAAIRPLHGANVATSVGAPCQCVKAFSYNHFVTGASALGYRRGAAREARLLWCLWTRDCCVRVATLWRLVPQRGHILAEPAYSMRCGGIALDEGLKARQQVEIDWWRDNHAKSQQAGWMQSIIERIGEARILLEKTQKFQEYFGRARTILELGGGECWGSCFVKHQYPNAKVIATDISEYAITAVEKWEYVFKTRVDETHACPSYKIPMEDNSVDLVWCYEAAHHFVAHRRTLVEIYRALAPGGTALYLREPSCRPYIHGIAHRRVNRKRPDVPEDVLVYSKIRDLAVQAGFEVELQVDPSPANRAPVETMYYFALQRISLLRNLLPCGIDYVFHKPGITER